jgi:hypothetical protein
MNSGGVKQTASPLVGCPGEAIYKEKRDPCRRALFI